MKVGDWVLVNRNSAALAMMPRRYVFAGCRLIDHTSNNSEMIIVSGLMYYPTELILAPTALQLLHDYSLDSTTEGG